MAGTSIGARSTSSRGVTSPKRYWRVSARGTWAWARARCCSSSTTPGSPRTSPQGDSGGTATTGREKGCGTRTTGPDRRNGFSRLALVRRSRNWRNGSGPGQRGKPRFDRGASGSGCAFGATDQAENDASNGRHPMVRRPRWRSNSPLSAQRSSVTAEGPTLTRLPTTLASRPRRWKHRGGGRTPDPDLLHPAYRAAGNILEKPSRYPAAKALAGQATQAGLMSASTACNRSSKSNGLARKASPP